MLSSEVNRVDEIATLTHEVRAFAAARDWDQFHDPKNLAMALASEVGELTAVLRWVRGDEADAFLADDAERSKLEEEIGDVGICLLLLCARTGIDLNAAVTSKLRTNAERYPVAISKGRAYRPIR